MNREVEDATTLSIFYELIAFSSGASLALAALQYWYLIAGPAGLTSFAALGIPVHHIWVGVVAASIGLVLGVSSHRYARIIAFFFLGFGLVITGEDVLQHCYIAPIAGGGAPGTCVNFP